MNVERKKRWLAIAYALCLCGAPIVLATHIQFSPHPAHYQVHYPNQKAPDLCGCPSPERVCTDPCLACMCYVMTPTVFVDEAATICWRECRGVGNQ